MFGREIRYINENGITATANMLRNTIPGIAKNLKEYTPRSEIIDDGFCTYTKLVLEDSFGPVSFILRYYPEFISAPDFDKVSWVTYLYNVNGMLLNEQKTWKDLTDLIEYSLDKSGETLKFVEDEYYDATYKIGDDPLARTPGENLFYNGVTYENSLMGTRYKDISSKDEKVIRKFLIITSPFIDEYVEVPVCSDFLIKRDALYEALLYDKADWEYNKIVTGDFVTLIQSIFNGKYPLIDSTIDLSDIKTFSNKRCIGWEEVFRLIKCIFEQQTAFILYNWYLMDKYDEERLNLFLCVTWVIQRYICQYSFRERLDDFREEALNNMPFTSESVDTILEKYGYTYIQRKKSYEIIQEFGTYTENCFRDAKNQIEELLDVLKCRVNQLKDKELSAVLVNGKDSIRMLQPDSKIFAFPFLPSSFFEVNVTGYDEQRRAIPRSINYTFLKDSESYDNVMDFHEFFRDDAYDEDIADWVIWVYKDLLYGGGEERFASNLSYQEWLEGEEILSPVEYDEDNEYYIFEEYNNGNRHICDFFPLNTNFRPYQDELNKIAIYQTIHNTLYKVFGIKGALGLALENCYWIDDFLTSQEGDEYNTSLEVLIASMREFIFGIPNAKIVRKNTKATLELNEKIKDLQRVKEVAAVFNSILLDIKDKEGLSRALNRWTKLYRGSLPMYVDKREDDVIDILYNEVLTGLNKALQRIPERSSQFNVICTDKRELFDRLETDFDKLYTGVDNEDELKRIMRSQTQEYLTDASLLYSMYVTDGAADTSSLRLNDYSPIAINYYRALEFLVNQMFYIPYRKRVLEANSNINNRSYLGTSARKIIVDANNGTCRPTLEIRTFAIFMGGIDPRSHSLVPESAYPVKLMDFLVSCDVDINMFRSFCLDLYDVGELRNACAHPNIQDESYAIKAKTVVYEHNNSDDARINQIPEAMMVYEMIVRLSELIL